MTQTAIWLVSLSIGPVQDFIDAALRTRDLWFGSQMLSQVSLAAAEAIRNAGGQLIFPFVPPVLPENDDDFPGVANRIVAEVPGSRDAARDVVEAGKAAARAKLMQFVADARNNADHKKVPLRDDVWQLQARPDDLLELYGSAVLMQGNYAAARARLDSLTAARKNSRDFLPAAARPDEKPGHGLPKSSLDGRRETVLQEQMDQRQRLQLRMGKGEQLDLLGLVKRLANERADQFTPTVRIALDPWLRRIKNSEEALEDVQAILGQLTKLPSALATPVRGNGSTYSALPFDGALLYQGVLDAALGRQGTEQPSDDELRHLRELRKVVMPRLWQQHGHPCPYYVLLRADGDHMGQLLDKVAQNGHHKTPQETLRELSRQLTKFAQKVPELARQHWAHCIYAGGDDVLLLAPLDTALPLADKLRQRFSNELNKFALDAQAKLPTLSIGLVVAHMQTPIGRVRRLAKEAEHLAKGRNGAADSRNALAVTVAPRSGATVHLRMSWADDPAKWLGKLAVLYREEKLPSGFPYELRQVAALVRGMADADQAMKLALLELERILGRKNKGGGREQIDKEGAQAVLDRATRCVRFEDVCQQHLVARWLGARGEVAA